MPTERNRRRQRRIPSVNPVRISWEDRGQPHFAIARCIDISESGLRIESAYPIRPGTTIMIASDRLKLNGAATVRHMARCGGKYLLGAQLNQAALREVIARLEGDPVATQVVTVLIENLNRTHQKV